MTDDNKTDILVTLLKFQHNMINPDYYTDPNYV